MGSLVKTFFSKDMQVKPDDIYHVTIMPCYDKKLEASREDFYNDVYSTRDVDLVITSMEVEKMLTEKNIDLPLLQDTPLDRGLSLVDSNCETLLGHRGGGSGGYLEHTFIYAAKELFNIDEPDIQYKVLRNRDFQEVLLTVDGEVKLKFAFANGFRNIQNVVQKIKRKRCDYHFIEIMACPSGCVNGGGQIRADTTEEARDLLVKVRDLYDSLPLQNPFKVERVNVLLDEITQSDGQSLLNTQYHEIEKTVNALSIKW